MYLDHPQAQCVQFLLDLLWVQNCLVNVLDLPKPSLHKKSWDSWENILGSVHILYPKSVGKPAGHLMLPAEYPVQAVQC